MKKFAQALCLCSALSVAFSPWASAEPPVHPGDPLYTCYNASIVFDYECDGQGDVGVNEGLGTYAGCLNRLQQKMLLAQTNGWCYMVPSNSCSTYTSRTACR